MVKYDGHSGLGLDFFFIGEEGYKVYLAPCPDS